ncbi:MAG: carboxymuconolactone decarboxylase family protein [Chloroflexi bacterium]|nr:carboxymuconolactone decarboxylase family protein [Chloroflexota bacterium]
MARVSFMEKDKAHPMVKELFESNETRRGFVTNLAKVMGHCPYIGLNFQRLGNSLRKGEELPPKLRELTILRVGNLMQAEYEFKHHTIMGLQCGISQKQIDEVSHWTTSKLFNEQERAILAYTDEVTRDIKVKDGTFAKLQSLFSEHTIVELTALIGYYCMVCRILVALQVELEPDIRS